MAGQTVLLIGDDVEGLKTLAEVLGQAGFSVTRVSDRAKALEIMDGANLDLAVLDSGYPDHAMVGIVPSIRLLSPATKIIVTSVRPTLSSAIEAVRQHVFDYIQRPEELGRLPMSAREALMGPSSMAGADPGDGRTGAAMEEAPFRAPGAVGEADDPSASILIGQTSSMVNARRLVTEVAPSDMTVLIRGESGTGKDVVARLIHKMSGRRDTGTFVKINCPAIPETLLESELFGYEKGAFTGAVTQKPGRFELAEKGTLFLDEIGSVSLAMQAKLLEVIEYKQFMRVGGRETISVDTRIIAATHCPLEDMIAKGQFRADLFYRLKQFTINLPPLRDRIVDIPLLCGHFLRMYAAKYGFKDAAFPTDIIPKLIRYPWPGNVREMESVIARFALGRDVAALEQGIAHPLDTPVGNGDIDRLQEVEAAAILAALTETRWNRRKAAEKLGISYNALRRRMAKYNLDKPGVPAG
jgi:two-component system response regulator AtoC